MAGNISKVILGFEDEVITDKYKLSCMVDKIGGTPDWPDCVALSNPSCRLCGRVLPLVCQLYAPLASSPLHRTLYLFACVSPGCWDQDDSWACLRCQWPDASCVLPESLPPATTDWCVSAEEWGDADEDRANGNTALEPQWSSSDEEDEEGGDVFRLAGLSLDERNTDAAAGQTRSPGASAEIEGPEGEVVTVDTPVLPAGNLLAVLRDDATSRAGLPEGAAPQFQAVFLATGEEGEEERPCGEHGRELPCREHGRELLVSHGGEEEGYEPDRPLHGDTMCYRFLLRLRRHPQQLLRYYIGTPPLLLRPLENVPRCCAYCRGPVACELQLLPTLMYRLRLVGSTGHHLEFSSVLVWSCQGCCWAEGDLCRREVVTLQSEHSSSLTSSNTLS
ncbi:programmed cell death protein 2-like isoform X2 [Bacillus rossius redtenbacheri]|uniref:programmed cell death protein 2-like isoform X2 n=1 Tax=Bacillus rossius redtenbacheri TaxID=93214 RepID=UPI002FDE3782